MALHEKRKMRSYIKERAFKALNLNQYNKINKPDNLGKVNIKCPKKRQYILRMLIKLPFGDFKIPSEINWTRPLINRAIKHQEKIGVKQAFCYITIRHGKVISETDDEWHVDGFSTNITHIPEQNYIWVDKEPTEYIKKRFKFPRDFSPFIHNIHYFFHDSISKKDKIKKIKIKNLYCFDPYVVHKRPKIENKESRAFVRISFCPVEINDKNNTQNKILPRVYTRDGIKEFRNNLKRVKIRKQTY